MDTDMMYMAISGEFDHGQKAEFLLTSKYHNRTPGATMM